MKMTHYLALTAVAGCGLTAALMMQPETTQAADHQDGPAATAKPSADIGDLYAWHKGDAGPEQKFVTILTFDGLKAAMDAPVTTYDADVLYTINVDNNGDTDADIQIYVRFGQNADGDWGMQIQNLPGTDGDVVGAVETVLNPADGVIAHVGIHDDPFFFDLAGFNATVETGDLAFSALTGDAVDGLAGLNTMAITLEMPMAPVLNGGTQLKVWATTATK